MLFFDVGDDSSARLPIRIMWGGKAATFVDADTELRWPFIVFFCSLPRNSAVLANLGFVEFEEMHLELCRRFEKLSIKRALQQAFRQATENLVVHRDGVILHSADARGYDGMNLIRVKARRGKE